MATLRIRDKDGEWHDFPAFVRVVFRNRQPLPVYGPPDPRRPVEYDPSRRCSLADEATWQHMRSLFATPEQLEGR